MTLGEAPVKNGEELKRKIYRVDVPVVGYLTYISKTTDRENSVNEVFNTILVYYHWLIYIVSIFKQHNC
jgi:hypothetical protein